MVSVREDLTDQHIHKFTVLQQTDDYISPQGVHYARWLCQCDCGSRPIKVRDSDLKTGNIKSCGCSRRKYNKYDLSGEYGIGWTSNTNKEFYFDLDDYDKIKNYCWYEIVNTNSDYHGIVTNFKSKMVRMSHVICGKYYDHINRNPLDNRKSNLRPANYTENARNYSIQQNNTSGYSGVSWDKERLKWVSYIIINKKRKKLGRFTNKEEAIKARLLAEAEHFGQFAPQRHLFEKYNITCEE